jgi:mannosyltransferase OCH1-like enzyme
MWKDKSTPIPSNLVRWRDGCMKLNHDFKFKFYYDDDLEKFVETEYPEYYFLFKSLYGVYMADMARVLLSYHYGGVYMDLDFYCYRPLHCLESLIITNTRGSGAFNSRKQTKDILIVSREPFVHAALFRKQERVVIQVYY